MHIAIAGNIGSGKSTLTQLLAERYGWEPHFEAVDNNPYLNDFYNDMQRWSFNLQIFFLHNRFNQIVEINQNQNAIVQDRTIYEDAFIFAPNLHRMGLMSTRDFENYTKLFDLMTRFIKPPDLLIYLKASIPTLIRQIKTRGRDFEANIDHEYLKNLNRYYNEWIDQYTNGNLLVLEVDALDYANKPEDFELVVKKINVELEKRGTIIFSEPKNA